MKYLHLLVLLTVITFQIQAQVQYDFYDTKVLTTSSGVNYTMGDFNKGLQFGEFLLGQQLTYSEKQLAIDEAIIAFEHNPHETIQNANIVHQTIAQVYGLNDALQIALARNIFLAQVYAVSIQSNESSVLFDLIQKYITILEIDIENQLILTEQDLDGFLNLLKFSTEASGQVFNPSYAEIAQAKQELRYTFVNGSLDDKQYLCVVNTYYSILAANYNQMNAMRQQQMVEQFMMQSQPTTPQYSNENTGTMDWNAYNMLSNMSLQNHASMLNSIEAIGGSGDYWYVE